MNLHQYLTFVAAAGLLAIIPGPGILFVLAQTSKGGKSAGFSGSFGTAIGGMFHVFAGAVGISAIVYSSAIAFEIVKTLGALYLFFLGWKALREKRTISADSLAEIKFESESLKQGIITEALNPKTALFFLALIPQFIAPAGNVAFQFFLLGTTSVILNTTVDLLVVLSSDFLIAQLRRSKFAADSFKYVSSTGYFGLGLLALRTSREASS
jgi:threonine/homoserine/homoserine lactone efflux protein